MTLSAAEQLLIEMINRTRLDPAGEAARYGIDLNQGLDDGTLDAQARQVLAPNQFLNDAAEAHSDWMLATNTFSHTGQGGSTPGMRMEEAGYTFEGRTANGENITYRGSTGPIDADTLMEENHHEDLFLSSGHRVNMLHDFYSEIGVAQRVGEFTTSQTFNASMVTTNFALSGTSAFVTGVVYDDDDGDAFYSIGEGQGGVSVTAAGRSTQSDAAGGYALALTPASNVTVTLGGITLAVDLSAGNAKLDLVDGNHVATSVDATLQGAAGSLTALGVGDISLTGSAGADTLVGNRGDNRIDGRAGIDTVRYDLTRAAATITQNDDGSIRVQSSEGTDRLVAVERLTFTDETVDLVAMFAAAPEPEPTPAPQPDITTPGGARLTGSNRADTLLSDGIQGIYASELSDQVFRLYQATLGRAPDVKGHASWTKALQDGDSSLVSVAQGFVGSLEFQRTYGDLDTEGFVSLLYQNVLGREPDAKGLAGWSGQLDEGQIGPAGAVIGFSQSTEFMNATQAAADTFSQARMPGGWTDEVFRLYAATLDRAPDQGGLEGWSKSLAEGTDLPQVVAGFVGSPEFQNTYGDLDDAGFVELMYRNVLDRAPDATGERGFLDALAAGDSRADVVIAFAQSREFIQKTDAAVHDWVVAQGVDDVLNGGAGNDVLAGGSMRDVFVFNAEQGGAKTVLDFEAWDLLSLEGFGYATADAAQAQMQQRGNDVVFQDQGVKVTLENIALEMIADDMILV